ncbi:MAG TPA: protein translocase subunit SecDF, partial [Parasegetibacter sp.]
MQLKGLVRFFTIALIVISIYQLSFTWFVNRHEKKMEEKARKFIADNYPSPEQKYPGDNELQVLYRDTLNRLFEERKARLLDSTKNETVTYGIQGPISYQKAKESELNLGLDLQGGMSVTMEVGLDGLIRSMANNSKDPDFNKAIENANKRKANSDADFVSLFAEEYKKLNPSGRLASLFANPTNKNIKISDSDADVLREIRNEASEAIKRTYRVIQTRIDKFGVAQPNVNLDATRGIINVELAGVSDAERVRKYLQSSANLQFWEVYNIAELDQSLMKAEETLAAYLKGGSSVTDSSTVNSDSSTQQSSASADTTGNLSDILAGKKADTATAGKDSTALAFEEFKRNRPLASIIQFIEPTDRNQDGQPEFSPALGYVAISDTALVRQYLNIPAVRAKFPGDVRFLYGIPEKDAKGKPQNFVAFYAIKTVPGSDKARLEGEHIIEAGQDYDPITSEVTVNMSMDKVGTKIWAQMTEKNKGRAIAIVLDDVVYSAPNVNEPIPNGSSRISGNFTVEDAQDLANILKAGKLPAPAKIVQEQLVGPTLGAEAIKGGSLAFLISFGVIFVLMLLYFNTSGWVANIALVLNLLFTIGILSALGATLTAPGIAGLV